MTPQEARARPRPRHAAALGALFAVALAAYGPLWRVGFLSDDFALIEDPHAQSHALAGFYRPVPGLVFTLQGRLFGLVPARFHAVSLALHVLDAWLLYLLLLRMTGAAAWALAGAVLFAGATVHCEAVYWTLCQNYLLEAAFTLLALLLLDGAEVARVKLLLAVASVTLALLCRESAIMIVPLLLAWDLACGPVRTLAAVVRRHALFALPLIAYVGSFLVRVGGQGPGSGYRYSLGWHVARNFLHFAVACLSFTPFDDAAVVPLAQRLLRGLPRFLVQNPRLLDPSLASASSARGLLAAGATLAVLAAIVARGGRLGRLGLSMFALTAVPYVGMASPLGPYPHRFCYLPSMAMAIALVGAASAVRAPRGRVVLGALVAAGVLLLPAQTFVSGFAYRKATVVVSRVVEAVTSAHLPPGTYVMSGVPDSFEGAYIFRNGLAQAVRISTGARGLDVLNADRVHAMPTGARRLALIAEGDAFRIVPGPGP